MTVQQACQIKYQLIHDGTICTSVSVKAKMLFLAAADNERLLLKHGLDGLLFGRDEDSQAGLLRSGLIWLVL